MEEPVHQLRLRLGSLQSRIFATVNVAYRAGGGHFQVRPTAPVFGVRIDFSLGGPDVARLEFTTMGLWVSILAVAVLYAMVSVVYSWLFVPMAQYVMRDD
jgi:hypothetical protein